VTILESWCDHPVTVNCARSCERTVFACAKTSSPTVWKLVDSRMPRTHAARSYSIEIKDANLPHRSRPYLVDDFEDVCALLRYRSGRWKCPLVQGL